MKILAVTGGYLPAQKYGGPVTSLVNFVSQLGDEYEIEYLKENLRDSLVLGPSTGSNDISFIPFLDRKKCKYFAAFNSQLEADKSFVIPGVDKIPLRELPTFTN